MAAAGIQDLLQPVELTSSLRPKLSEGEVEFCFGNHVRVYYRDSLQHENGSCYLTGYRIIWLSNKRNRNTKTPISMFALPLSKVKSCSCKAGMLISSPKLVVHLTSGSNNYIKLSFRDGNRNKFHDNMNMALRGRAWLAKKSGPEKKDFSTTGAGIRGLMEREKKKKTSAQRDVDEAFQDLNALMAKAGEMVSLAKRCADGMAAREETKKGDKDRFMVMLADMGIPSPVTRESAGTKYHEQLAMQLADFMQGRLGSLGGMITLPDAYCLFNRARGTEMVSPDDILNACMLFESLELPIVFRKFPSNVLVIQAKDHSDRKMAERITGYIGKKGSVSGIELSQAFGLSLVLTKQHLLQAEKLLYICRDQSTDGLRFYRNLFINSSN